MSNDIKELIDRLRTDSLDATKASLSIMDLCMEAAEALENLDAQLDVCIQGDINKTRENEILLSALTKWGAGMQTVMVFEEMAELQKELCKSLRGKDNRGYIAEEIADVRLMLDQMVILHDCAEDVDTWRKVKLGRLDKMVEKNYLPTKGLRLTEV